MKVAEFAEKYGQSVTLVREASFKTDTRRQTHGNDFPEEELFHAVKETLEKRIENGFDSLNKNIDRLARLYCPH